MRHPRHARSPVLHCTLAIAAVCVVPRDTLAADVLSTGRIVETLVALVIIVAMIFALAFMARRLQGLRPRSNGPLKIIDTLSLGARERIVLIDVDGERVLVAVAGGRIETLHAAHAPSFKHHLRADAIAEVAT